MNLGTRFPLVRSLTGQYLKSRNSINFRRKMSHNPHEIPEPKDFEEVRIQVPWGHLAGKWWGPKNVRPIIGLHGWQDNAGTFDTLAPLLPKHVGFLAIDLPGHGLSSRIPDGMMYSSTDTLYCIKIIMKEYNMDKLSLIGHSMSAIIGFIFASVFPNQIDMLIGIDALKPHIREPNQIVDTMGNRLNNFMIADERNQDKSEPPSYTYDELIEKLFLGSFNSISKESCPYLLERNIHKSSKYPEKYYFTRDSRLKAYIYSSFSQETCLEMAKRIVAPFLFIKSTDSTYFEQKKYFDETIEVLKNNPKFELHRIQGTHHLHLNDPTKISGIINTFIDKYHPPEVISKL